MGAEPEHEWRGAQLYDLGQGELDGCGGARRSPKVKNVKKGVASKMGGVL